MNYTRNEQPISIAILGLGPRGLNVMERITAHILKTHNYNMLHIHIIDPGTPGVGIHHNTQPDHLLLNTVASQITMFMDPSVKDAGPILPGPNMYEWAAGLDDKRYNHCTPNSYLPRRLFGEYLNWVYKYLSKRLERFCQVTLHQTHAFNISQNPDNSFTIQCMNEETIDTDFLFLSTGHSENLPDEQDIARMRFVESHQSNNKYLKYIPPMATPIFSQFDNITPGTTVAIEGMGLTAIDAVTSLTIGKGGGFHRNKDSGELCYNPSGNEPNIVIFSRSGLPLSCRAMNQKGASEQYTGRFLTAEKVSEWTHTKPKGSLDFLEDVFPLLLRDIEYVYYTTQATSLYGKHYADLLGEALVRLTPKDAKELLQQSPDIKLFSWTDIANPIDQSALQTPTHFKNWLIRFLQQDLIEANIGNITSPIKAACDVLRDLRDNLRNAIDFGALSCESYAYFLKEFIPIMNRLAVGPPIQRLEEIMALYRAGYLEMGLGANPKVILSDNTSQFQITSTGFNAEQIRINADVLYRAQIPKSKLDIDNSPLIRQLLNKGLIRQFKNGELGMGGIDIDRELNIVTASGGSLKNAWALGTVSEGAKFYTYIVPRPCVNSTALVDAGKSVNDMFQQIMHSRPQIQKQDSFNLTIEV